MVIEKQPKNREQALIIVFSSCRFHWLKRVIPKVVEVQKLLEKRKRKKGLLSRRGKSWASEFRRRKNENYKGKKVLSFDKLKDPKTLDGN